MSDRRLWVKIDRGYLDNPKMLDVLDASSTAPLMHLASILYCSQHLTDGHINPSVARRKVGGTKEDERVLIEAGMWHEPGHDCDRCPQPAEGKVYVHDYLEHNQSAHKAERVSQKRSEAAQKRWNSPEMQSASNLHSNADANLMQRREEKRREDPRASADAERGPSSPEHRATDRAYEATGKAFNFIATRGIAKWLIHDRHYTEQQVSDALIAVHRSGRPITKQTMDQHLTRSSPSAQTPRIVGQMNF